MLELTKCVKCIEGRQLENDFETEEKFRSSLTSTRQKQQRTREKSHTFQAFNLSGWNWVNELQSLYMRHARFS